MRTKRALAVLIALTGFAGGTAGSGGAAGGSPVQLEGKLVTVHSDDFAHGRSSASYRLETATGAYELELAGADPILPRANKVAVHGVANGRTVTVAAGGVTAAAGGTVAAAPTGTKRLAVILFTFSDNATQPYTPATARGVAFTNSNSVAAYYQSVSWGQLSLTGDVLGWYSIPDTSTTCNYTQWAADADKAAQAAGVDLSAYDYKTYAFPNAVSCSWSGLAYLPGTQSWLNGTGGMSLAVLAHELGHNLGTHHANSYSCTSGGVRVALAAASSCSSTEYGDRFSVMGSLNTHDQTNFSRASIGWLPASATLDVSADGAYTLGPIESSNPGGAQAIRIRRDASTYLLLEFRQPDASFDNFTSTDPVVNGVTVRIVPGYTTLTQSQLVDTTPATSSFTDAPLAVGRSLSDPVSGVTITTTAIASSGATVQVSFGSSGSDTQAPTTPASLTAAATDSAHVNLTWAASTDNVGVTGYRIYRGGGYLTTVASVGYTDGGLSPNTSYSYYVQAVDAAGNQSAASNTATAVTPSGADVTPPSAPASLSAHATDTTHVALAWSASADNVGVTGYRIYRGGGYLTTVASVGYTDGGLSPNTSYSYYVQAVDAAGNQSAASNTATAVTPSGADVTPPSAPASLSAHATDTTHVALAWSASADNVGVTGYRVYRGGGYLTTVASTGYTDSGLSPNTSYSYYVKAVDAAGNQSAASNTATTATPSSADTTAPSAPAGLTARATDTTHVALAWSASTDNVGVTGYLIYRGGSYLTKVASTGYTDSGLSPNTSYSYYVKAVDAAGNQSAASNTTSARTADTVAPSAPTSLSASEVDVQHIALTWAGSTDDVAVTGYKIYRNGSYLKTVTTTSYTDGSNLASNTTYSYFVTARDAAGNESARSNTASAATLDTTPPTAPVLTAKVSNVTSSYLTWTASSDDVRVLGYRVYRNGVLLATISPGTRSYTDQNAPAGTDSYSVVAYDAAGNVAVSNTVILAF